MNPLLLLVLFFALLPVPGRAQRIDQLPSSSGPAAAAPTSDHVAAVVNDNVISTLDIDARIRLAMLSAGLPDTPEVRQKLFPQILRSLIDEQLQMQEAKRIDVNVTPEEIDQALARIAHDNNIPGDMKTYVASHGVPVEALTAQIRAGLAWNKVIQRELRPRVEVGDDEVDAAIERIRANAGKVEYLVSEIVLPVDTPQDEEQVRQFADNLVQQIKGGASFAAIARQFSQGSGAAAGGDIGWTQEGQLPAELDHALESMNVGDIAGPIRTASGFHIIGLRDRRTISLGDPGAIKLSLQQVFRPFGPDIDKDTLLQEAERLRGAITDCKSLRGGLADKFPGWQWQDMGSVTLAKAPAWLADKVRDVEVGKGSDPLATDKGALIVFVCGRQEPETSINRDAIFNSIGTDKLELQARRLLRDLRRAAYIDIRLSSAPA